MVLVTNKCSHITNVLFFQYLHISIVSIVHLWDSKEKCVQGSTILRIEYTESWLLKFHFKRLDKTEKEEGTLQFCSAQLLFSCPFDYVKVYDGSNNSAPLVGSYCGQQRNLVVYSSEAEFFVEFSSLQRTANTQNRGFKGIFEFSESFVKLGKLGNSIFPFIHFVLG